MDKITKSIRQISFIFLLSGFLITGLFNVQKHASYAEGLQAPVITPITNESTKIKITDQTVQPNTDTENDTNPPTTEVLGLKIDAINLNIPLGKTSLDAHQALMVPENPNQAAWYKSGPKPGEAGSALITGHLDSAAGPGVFYNLRKLVAGDKIEVKRDDGKIVTYQVEKSESYPQDITFPWNKVYTVSGASTLRIITCDGTYNSQTGHYSRNLVVYAKLVSVL
jgi:LPXTG-site transpeptidase (sortase) family protein